jgi:alpha-mannosidase/mannosylglycerate hydrolase
LTSYRFGDIGYCDFAIKVRHGNQHEAQHSDEQLRQDLQAYIEQESQKVEVGPILAFDGGDHMEWDRRVYALLKEAMEVPNPDYKLLHSSLDGYLAELQAHSGKITTQVKGELREPGYGSADEQWLIPGVLSSRVWIKQHNAACQTLLCQWAEPFSAIARLTLNEEYPQGFLNLAWKWLLINHAHDSICGCSVDAVHEDMRYRFHQSQDIATHLRDDACRKLACSVEGEIQEKELRLTVFNPSAQAFEGTTELDLDIPADWPTFNEFFGFEPKPAFRLYAAETGGEIPYQRLGQAMRQTRVRHYGPVFPQSYPINQVRVSAPLHLPALGYATLLVRPGQAGRPTRHPESPGLATSERSMANEIIEATIEANGTLTIQDKRNGQIYNRALTQEDSADIGDGWFYGMAANDQTFVSSASQASVALVHNGPYLTTFRVRTLLPLPREFDFATMRRSDQLSEFVIDSLVSLRPGKDYLEVEMQINNTAKDHRLRLLFPSGAAAQTYLTDTPFDVVERPVALREDNYRYRELDVETRPQQSWTAVYYGGRGLALISRGLMEACVRDLPERPIALTLFRSTGRTVFTQGEPDGQVLGEMLFRYWIVPLAEAPDRGRLSRLGEALAGEILTVQLTQADQRLYSPVRRLPSRASFLSVTGPAVVTSLRMAGDRLELRCFNPEPMGVTIKVDCEAAALFQPELRRWEKVDFEGRSLGEEGFFEGASTHVALRPKEIATLRFS